MTISEELPALDNNKATLILYSPSFMFDLSYLAQQKKEVGVSKSW